MQQRSRQLLFSPSDLTAYLACEHLTQLQRRVALGQLAKPAAENPEADLVKRKGEEHERAYLDALRASGGTVAEISLEPTSTGSRPHVRPSRRSATELTSSIRASSWRTAGAA